MLATICDGTWNVLNMQHITPNSKRWDYSDIPSGGHKKIKGPAHMVEGDNFFIHFCHCCMWVGVGGFSKVVITDHHLGKAPNPHPHTTMTNMDENVLHTITKQAQKIVKLLSQGKKDPTKDGPSLQGPLHADTWGPFQ